MKCQNLTVSMIAVQAILGLTIFATGDPAHAQGAAGTTSIEEIIVRANKRDQSVQDVAQVVNVVSGEALQDLEIRSFQEIENVVAGLDLSRVSGGEQSASMRGIKMSNPGGAASATNTVEMYVNEVPITAVDSFNTMFDVGQIEVLRGPQGTLRGRPSPSGAITITPRRGSFEGSDGYVQVGASDNGGTNVQLAWGGPLSDNVAVRVSGIYDESNDNGFRSLGNGKRSNHESYGLRAILDWRVTDNFDVSLMHQYNDQDQDFYRGIEGTVIHPPESIAFGETFTYEDRISLNQSNPNSYEANLTTLQADYNFENHALHYVGGYKSSNFQYVLDFDFAGVGGQPYISLDNDNEIFSNELRFESTTGEVFNYTIGVFTSESDFSGGFLFSFERPIPPIPDANYNPYTFEDTGLFGNVRFDIGDSDFLSVGVRRSEYTVDRSGTAPDVDYSATTGNASYQHDFSETLMAYVSYGKSFRPGSGGANNTGANPIPDIYANYDEEESRSIEVGVKSEWFDRRLTLNLAYYDQKYDGFIAVTNNVACTGVPNPNGMALATRDGTVTGEDCRQNVQFNGDATAEGIELEMRALVTDAWTLGLIYSYVDAKFDNALIPCNDYDGNGVPDNIGNPMIQQNQYVSECRTSEALGAISPHSFTATTDYDFNIGNLGAYARANLSYNDQSYFPQTGLFLPSDTRVNAYLGLRGEGNRWEISVWAKNLFDNVVQDNDGGTWNVGGVFTGLSLGTISYGREIGGTLRWEF